jgi:diguanylate cyclase (GGDEF)-like protein
MRSISFKLVAGAVLLSLLVAVVAAVAIVQQLDTAEAAARLEAENLATVLAYSSAPAQKDRKQLQALVVGLHEIYHRDLTIVDTAKVGIADSDVGDVGNVYRHDLGGEVALTMKDGKPRQFTEVSPLFPQGTRVVVVASYAGRPRSSAIAGAVILEYTPIYEELVGRAKQSIALVALAAAGCIVLALAVGVLVARRITRPIVALTRAAAGLAAGNFDRVAVSARADEVGRLGQAFNDMASQLQDNQEALHAHGRELEARVAQRTAQLSERNREITLFSRIGEFLQASDTESEAYSVISNSAAQLFPKESGALYVMSPSRNLVEANAAWGESPPANVVFPPNDCWALRRGQAHVCAGDEVRCRHVGQDGRLYACLPLIANGETLGILHVVNGVADAEGAGAARLADNVRLAKSFAEHIGLAIANLRLRDAMRSLSIRDPLTGLFNRRYMEEALAQELFRAKRQSAPLVLMMLDIDHFKRFNDEFGHDGGDAVLRELGAYLKKVVRGSDVVCRYGGEEFMLLLSPTTLEGARLRAEALREGVRNLAVRHARASLGTITVSVGLAVFPEHGAEPEALIKAADIALYQAKQAGRDRVVVYAGRADLASA